MIDFNTEPYNDDYNENNKFYRILFRPSFAVQARELTQMQSILQNQIKRHGDHIFKQGAMVIPGQISIDSNVQYVKIQPIFAGAVVETYVNELEGLVIVGQSGLTAQVIKVENASGADFATLYVRYTNSGNDSETKVFADDEVITPQDPLLSAYTVQAISDDSTGTGSTATIERGVYYVNGHFVLVDPQIITLDKYSNTPTYRVGLSLEEKLITPEDPGYEMLLDNAQNSYNFAAPGAHRYYIDLVLSKKSIDAVDDAEFIELLRVDEGRIIRHVTTTDYSQIEKTLARRTFDESGNYTVRPFPIDIREHRNNNRGAWATNVAYLIGDVVTNGTDSLGNPITYVAKNSASSINVPPTHTIGTAYDGPGSTGVQWEYDQQPAYNRGVYSPEDGGDEAKLAVGLEPGKAYVQGYEIEKIATEYVAVDKARNFVQVDNAIVPATVGNYVLITNLNNLPPVHNFGIVDLYNRTTNTVGYQGASAHPGTITGTTSSATITGTSTAFVANGIQAGDLVFALGGSQSYTVPTFLGTVSAVGSATSITLTANAAAATTGGTILTTRKVGTARVRLIEWHNGDIGTQAAQYKLGLFDVQMAAGSNFSRNVKSIFFSNGDANLNFSADILPNYSRLVGSATASSTTVTGTGTSFQTDLIIGDYVRLGTEVRRVIGIASQTSITVDATVTVTGVTIDRLSTEILEPENTSLLYQIPYYAIKSVRSALGTNDTAYTVYERFTGTTSSAASGVCTLTATTSSGTFASAAETDNYILVNNSSTSGGAIVAPNSITVSGSTVQFVLPDTFASTNFIIIGAVNKTGATLTEKSKTLTTATVTFTTQANTAKSELLLGKADGYRVASIKMDSGTFASPAGSYTIDVSDRYDFDSGQRATHYDVARLILKSSYSAPAAPVQVVYEYFAHSTGDYFTVNSYPSNVKYENIPSFQGGPLRDHIDFRPRISDDGTGFGGSGASVSLVPKRGIDIRADYSYYLARKTKIAMDFNGLFFSIDGVSSLTPGDPLDPSLGMILYNLTLEPYTFGTTNTNITIQTYDNKRYTMRDIGKLEKRIDNLEYYTSLSLLEQQTESLNIIDSEGDSRFKNGFIVDGFTGHDTGDVNSPDYLCSIDMEKGELRPFYSMQNVNLIEKNSNNSQRAGSNYQLYGDVITLPVLEHVPLVKQDYASRIENINPFAIFTFLGNVKLTPSTDDWFEVARRPDIVIDVEGNFTTIRSLAERAGVLGTIWNAWQNQWTGATTTTVTAVANWGRNWVWTGNVIDEATPIGQSRTGVRTTLVTKIDRQVVADRVLSTAAIPYIRSRNILVQVKALKPNTRFYPFFDDVDISAYCTPAGRIVYTPAGSTPAARVATHNLFDDSTNVGGLATATARRIAGDTQVCLNRGDVITGQTSGVTMVVVGKEYNPDTNTFSLFVSNASGVFQASETFVGSVSGVTGTFVSAQGVPSQAGSSLITNFSGDLNLLFRIPNTESIRFRTGAREFKLVDTTQATGAFTSRGRAFYRAEGVLETRQQTVNAVRNAELVEQPLTDSRVIVQTSQRIEQTGFAWWDPLAQTFLVEQKGGAFLTKVDVFFASKDDNVPVNLEIREVVNGYPGKLVLPFSRVSIKPSEVNLSSTTVNLDGVAVPKYDTPTTFNFASPVYVQDNTEYAIVLSSDSNNYNVWISQIGDQIPGSSRTISEQPYMGVFFKSQNASTWTADQTQDLKFTIYRAKFATNTVGNVEFVNDVLPFQSLDIDPIETRAGQDKVRIYQRDHGMPAGSRVVISDLTAENLTGYTGTGIISASTSSTTVTGVGTSFTTELAVNTNLYTSAGVFIGRVSVINSNTSLSFAANSQVNISSVTFKQTPPLNGLPANAIYTTHVISDVDLDSYCITAYTPATSTGYCGGDTIRATRNMQYDAVQPLVQVQTFSETMTTFGIKSTSGKSVDSSTQTAYALESSFSDVLANENNYFAAPRMVASEINETNSLGGNKSVTFNVVMQSSNDSLSPILDTQRISLAAIHNKVNSPTETNVNVANLDDNTLLSANTTLAFDAATDSITTTNSTARQILQTITVGKFVTISGSTSALNDGTFLVTGVTDDGTTTTVSLDASLTTQSSGTAITVKLREIFVAEISPVGSTSYSKYVTKKVNLANASNFVRIRLAASIPPEASLEVYYKVGRVGSTAEFNTINWTLLNPDARVINVPQGDDRFIDMNFSSGNINAFEAVQVKLVMKSTNSSAIPRVKDLRVIACA